MSDLPLFIGIFLLMVCAVTHFFPPRKINYLYGYRTSASMKSQQRWDFAQQYSMKRMMEYARYPIVAGIALPAFKAGPLANVIIGMVFLFGLPAYLIIKTERALKKNFPDS